ncbi:MAG: SUKH-3 domain-containing protein [Oscillospiraceae bacterium]|nr:SUKH-3 domain-containing protein [Oscillospiraceae bacterium]
MLEEQTLLTGTPKEKVIQCLKKAGWYEGRKTDITEVESYYSGKGITLTESQKDIFREFYGLAEAWFFDKKGSIKNQACDFLFHIIPEDYYSGYYSYYDLEKLEQEAGERPISIGEIGYHYPSSIFLSCNGRLWEITSYDDFIQSYDDMISLIKYTGVFDRHDWNSVRMRQHE